jgi:hypothetical protein
MFYQLILRRKEYFQVERGDGYFARKNFLLTTAEFYFIIFNDNDYHYQIEYYYQ